MDEPPVGIGSEFESAVDQFSTPFKSVKTSELNVQFSLDPSFGLSKKQYGWYSNDTFFDRTNISDGNGTIDIETSATVGDSARLRSAYPGRYVSHTLAEPGVGLIIPDEHIERDENNHTSLTHGEISAEIVEWDETTDSGVNAHGISFEPDGTYFQIRRGDEDIGFIHQRDWNIDSMDGDGRSGRVLKPENGYVFMFPFTWYNQGALYLAVYDAEIGEMIPLHRFTEHGDPSLGTPNLPIQVTVENKQTADPLGARVGGMQYSTHGGKDDDYATRSTEESRYTSSGYISSTVSTVDNAIDPFAAPGQPLVSVRRDLDNLDSRVSLSVSVEDFFIDVDADCWVFIFDEYNEESALTGHDFTSPASINGTDESRVETDTVSTAYSPSSEAILRGMAYITTDNKTVNTITGDQSSRLPLEATTVCTAALAQGSNATDAQPFLLSIEEGY